MSSSSVGAAGTSQAASVLRGMLDAYRAFVECGSFDGVRDWDADCLGLAQVTFTRLGRCHPNGIGRPAATRGGSRTRGMGVNVLHRLRAAQGILRLGERHGAERLDAACELALGAGDPSYRTIKGALESGYDRASAAKRRSTADIPAYLHGADTLFGEVSR